MYVGFLNGALPASILGTNYSVAQRAVLFPFGFDLQVFVLDYYLQDPVQGINWETVMKGTILHTHKLHPYPTPGFQSVCGKRNEQCSS